MSFKILYLMVSSEKGGVSANLSRLMRMLETGLAVVLQKPSSLRSLANADAQGGAGTVPQPKSESKGRSGQRMIIHLDMDCFFASVAALTDPSLQGLPLLVCHSNSAQGTGEARSSKSP